MNNKLLLLAFWLCNSGLYGQNLVSQNYTFIQYEGVYQPIIGGTILISAPFDDQSVNVTLPSPFAFNGAIYTDLNVTANGSVYFGSTTFNNMYLPLSSNNAQLGVIAPFGRDLQSGITIGTSLAPEVRFETVNDEIVFQWQDVRRFGVQAESFSFQLRLNTATNAIRFIYDGSAPVDTNNNASPQVGLRGPSNSDFFNRSVTTDNNWINSVSGTVNNATCRFSSIPLTTYPTAGLTYEFTTCIGVLGCMDTLACNFNIDAVCENGSCEYCSCEATLCGCLDSTACNYDASVVLDNGTCDYSCYGCTNPSAYNYNAQATIDDGSCFVNGSGVTCNFPIPLDCAVGYYTGMTVGIPNDNITSGASVCSGISINGQLWYVYSATFNSEITISTIGSLTNFDTDLKVYTGSCGNLNCVTQNDDISTTNFQSQCVFNAIAGTNYLIRVGGWSLNQGTFSLTINCGGGCLDPAACNYQANAPFDDGSCTYGADCFGCIDENANNYDPMAVYDNNTCQYDASILIYHDLNGDGVMQSNEPGLPNWAVYIDELQATVYSNSAGIVNLSFASGIFTMQLVNGTTNWISTSNSTAIIDVPSSNSVTFGLIPATGETFFVNGPYNGFWDIIHCTNGYEAGIYLNNTGAVSLNGTITLSCDSLFTPEADSFGTVAPTAVGPGYALWTITDFLAGSNSLFSFHIDGPGVNYLGDTFDFDFTIVLTDALGNEIYSTTYNTSPWVACAYDPNDITATPEGYGEPHFILAGERIQYRVRFQNTGNLPAEDITIVDQLDPAIFDIASFQPMYASAQVTACLHDDGLLDFMFNDIFLPDSTNNEEESHGFVVFSIELIDNLPPGTLIENYADIYFEQNPAITTNTAFHTIFDCQSFVVASGDNELCDGETTLLQAEQQYVESYNWTIDDMEVSTSSSIVLSELTVGEHIVVLNVSNPLCGSQSETVITIYPLPTINSGSDVEICAGESITLNATSNGPITWSNGAANGTSYSPAQSETLTATSINTFNCTATDELNIAVNDLPGITILENGAELTAPDGSNWQWYLNGELIVGATEQVYVAATEGEFYVVTINSSNCSAQSTSVFISSVGEGNAFHVVVYPNPVQHSAMLMLPAGIFQIALYDQAGKLVENFGPQQSQFILERKSLAAGSYQLMISNNEKSSTVKIVLN
jgi:hypothetical protein